MSLRIGDQIIDVKSLVPSPHFKSIYDPIIDQFLETDQPACILRVYNKGVYNTAQGIRRRIKEREIQAVYVAVRSPVVWLLIG